MIPSHVSDRLGVKVNSYISDRHLRFVPPSRFACTWQRTADQTTDGFGDDEIGLVLM